MTLAADAAFEAPERGAGLAEHRALRALAARSDRRGLAQLAGHIGALLASGLLVAQAWGSLWLAPAMLLHGILLTFLFAPLHETIHRTAFRRRWLNDATAWLCGLALALPPEYFRAFHFAHHRHTQDPARDPELAEPKPGSMWAYVRHVSGLPYWYSRAVTLARHARGRVDEPFITERLRPAIVCEARLYLAVYAVVLIVSLAAGSAAALIFWLIPALLGQPFLRCYLLAEHTGCPLVADMLRNTQDHAQPGPGAPPRLEHALSRRASRLPLAAVPRPAGGAPAARAQDRGPGKGLRGRQPRDHHGAQEGRSSEVSAPRS